MYDWGVFLYLESITGLFVLDWWALILTTLQCKLFRETFQSDLGEVSGDSVTLLFCSLNQIFFTKSFNLENETFSVFKILLTEFLFSSKASYN